jgi:membrane protease YdiL (CAAX protease family)
MLAFVALAYAFTWACILPPVIQGWPDVSTEGLLPYLLVGQFGPTVAALVVTARTRGRRGVGQLLRTLRIVRFSWRWWFVAGWLVGITLVATSLVAVLLNAPDRAMPWLSEQWRVVMLPLVGVIGAIFGAGPIGEELGWRGYLLPRLLRDRSPLASSVILGLIWTFWHLPLFVVADWRNGLDLPLFALLYPLSLIIISHGMFVLWRNTGGSVLAAILFHGCLNGAAANILPEFVPSVAGYVAAVAGMAAWALVARALDDPSRTRVLGTGQAGDPAA